jgi:hypothetical protein
MPIQQKKEVSQATFESIEQLLKKQNRGAVSDRGETSRRTANGIDIGGIYGKQQHPSI